MPLTFYTAEIIDIVDEVPNVKRFFFRIEELNKCDFIPGQFTMLDLPIDCKQTTRAYSIASAPSTSENTFELIIVLKEGGLGTTYLFNQAKKGDKLKVSVPIGKFGKPRPDAFEKELCFVCTGTGIAPFRSMLLDILNYKIPHKGITLISGSRYEKDLLYKKEMEELQDKLLGFKYIPVLSRENSIDWKGEKGYVHEIYKALYKDKIDIQFYICGWKVMILEAVENLKQMGFEKADVKYELYD
jgi:CDP-4-dehydro-6-deoxyglucose reductase